MTTNIRCPLCNSNNTEFYFEDKYRQYLQCNTCNLVFVPEEFWPDEDKQKAIYDLHENDSQDAGYRKFLSRLTEPFTKRLGQNQKGLDFGCGPGPTISVMLEEHGHRIDLYDPFYHNNPEVFNKQYDFITATEVVEHLTEPGMEFKRLLKMLGPGGILGVMTKLVIDKNAFSRWHYIQDETHISFFSKETFHYIAKTFNLELTCYGKDVIILQKPFHY